MLLVAAVSSSLAVADQLNQTYLEIDVIFPLNQTYKPTDVFPIALAVQNITALAILGNYKIRWTVASFTEAGVIGRVYGEGYFALDVNEETSTGPVILVDTINVTEWIWQKDRGMRYRLGWGIFWDKHPRDNGCQANYVSGGLMFGIEADWEKQYNGSDGWVDGGKGIPPDVTLVRPCPALGQLVNITPNSTTSSCPTVTYPDTKSGRQGNPCDVRVGRELARSIASKATSLAAARLPPTRTRAASTSTNAAAQAAGWEPVQTAIAAACVLGGLMLAGC